MNSAASRITHEKETLFIPLYSKAIESQRPSPILVDRKAEAILAQLDYDVRQLRVPAKTRVTLAIRAKKLDTIVEQFLAREPRACVVHLGCGLDSRVERVNRPYGVWYDVDFPEVIELRRQFYRESPTYQMLGSSAINFGWMDHLRAPGPTVVVAEGLMMYLREQDVKALIVRLHQRCAPGELAFDAFNRSTTARIQQHPSLRQTGAQVHWGIDRPQEIEQWAPGIRLLEEWPFTASEDIARLGWGYRLMFKLAGMFRAARSAHRILRYQLSVTAR